jgi:hypothetical protein
MDRVVLGRDAHHFRAAPGDRSDVGVGKAVLLEHKRLGGVDLGDGPGHLEIEDAAGFAQALGMLGRREHRPAIGALALEDGAAIMHRMGQHMDPGVAPGDQRPVHPDQTVAVVKSRPCHGALPVDCAAVWILTAHGVNTPGAAACVAGKLKYVNIADLIVPKRGHGGRRRAHV